MSHSTGAQRNLIESKMNGMLWETLAPWWGYIIAGAAGIGFGAFQVWLTCHAMRRHRFKWCFFAIKYALWLTILGVMSIFNMPLCLLFTACGVVAMLCATIRIAYKTRKEAVLCSKSA